MSGANIAKKALILLHERLNDPNCEVVARITTCIHDAIYVQCPKEYAQKVSNMLVKAMEDAHNEVLKKIPAKGIEAFVSDKWSK